MAIDHVDGVGYRIRAPRYGRYVVSGDGRLVRAALPAGGDHWQRLLVAQVLPLAATLQGVELLHASAVALDGRAYAFVAPSGTGKTSLAVHLVARGASLVADDALALETWGHGVRAHPGIGVVNVEEAELTHLDRRGRDRLGPEILRSDKVHLAVRAATGEAVPLAGLYFLTRGNVDTLSIERLEAPDPLRLLGSRYITYVRSGTGLVTQLDLCSRVATTVPTFEVRTPPTVDARALSAEIERHVRGLDGREAG